jgi:hypothetical protein
MMMLRILFLLMLTTPCVAAPYFVQCYDFRCKSTQELYFSAAHWREIRAIFANGVVDSFTEKQAIRRAIAVMERISGELSGTYLDKGGNYPGSDIAMQMDCIDESTNTFQYLLALEQLELLQWHRVDLKQRRIRWFATHWTAVIREVGSNEKFAVDSWYRDNGELPYIQPLEDWKRKRDFPVTFNPELATG